MNYFTMIKENVLEEQSMFIPQEWIKRIFFCPRSDNVDLFTFYLNLRKFLSLFETEYLSQY